MLQPVNKLPPEIIPRIAQHNLQGNTDTYSIIPLTHVCRYWRQSIISAPENWTLISSRRMGLMALTLERSGAAPLQLRLRNSVPIIQNFRDLITPHIQNTEILKFLELTTLEDFTQVLPNFPRSMPNLRLLDLEHKCSMPGWDPSNDPFGLFPDTLRSLTLYDIPLYPPFLKIRTLTELSLQYYKVQPSLDTLLDVLEENRSLESVDLNIDSDEYPIQVSQRPAVILNQLRHLLITSWDATISRILISNIPVRRGAHLGITLYGQIGGLGLNDILSGISMTHLSNLPSSTLMTYQSYPREIQLDGPNGSFSYIHGVPLLPPFAELLVLPIADVKELRLAHEDPSVVFHPSSFPALEALAIKCHTDISHLFSALFPNPSLFPSLKTLGFSNYVITEQFVEELVRFASDRKDTTSAWLNRVVIVHLGITFSGVSTVPSTYELEKHVPIVDVRLGREFPTDLFDGHLSTFP